MENLPGSSLPPPMNIQNRLLFLEAMVIDWSPLPERLARCLYLLFPPDAAIVEPAVWGTVPAGAQGDRIFQIDRVVAPMEIEGKRIAFQAQYLARHGQLQCLAGITIVQSRHFDPWTFGRIGRVTHALH